MSKRHWLIAIVGAILGVTGNWLVVHDHIIAAIIVGGLGLSLFLWAIRRRS